MIDTIFVEGILGSGKSTLAETIYRKSLKVDSHARFFAEHDIENPLDMTRKAVLSQLDYDSFCERCCDTAMLSGRYSRVDVVSRIGAKSKEFFGHKLVAYSQIYFNDPALQQEMESLYFSEICNGMIDKNLYFRLLSKLFQDYTDERTHGETHIFEGALLQNILFDLVAFYQCGYSEIADFYQRVLPNITSAEVHYIVANDIAITLKRAAQHRKSLLWMDRFSAWISNSPWGIANSAVATDLPVEFCKKIEEISQRLLRDIKGPNIHWHSSAEILKSRMENGNA